MEKYEIIQKLGTGACGAVYLAKDKESKRQFALKKIELDDKKKVRTKEYVLKEANILEQLKHPHIVGFQESFLDGNDQFLIILQDYCDDGTIQDKIQDAERINSSFEEKQIMEWFIQIVMAVQYIHSKKVLHRDLKTENVFLTKKNVIKIGDFGISKRLDNTIDVAKTVVGTPSYLSPELCQDIPYNSKSDIWAVGCVLYELCALHRPFDANSLLGLFFKIIKAEFEPIPSMYNTDLHSLVNSLLQKSPEERPSASAILNLPFIKEHLAGFIEEKETLLQQKVLKDNSSKQSPVVPSSAIKLAKHSDQSPSPRIRRKQNFLSPGDLQVSSSSVKRDPSPGTDQVKPDRSPKREAGEELDYSDDFDESSDSEIEEDIVNIEDEDTTIEQSVEYADDFEEYDSSEDLDEIVNQAKEAQDLQPVDDYFEESFNAKNAAFSQTQIIKRHYLDAIKKEGDMSQVQKLVHDGTLPKSLFGLDLQCTSDRGELCYLTSEDLTDVL
ncbi:hypothetical protein SNE40_001839 [Patella caerulea]|uniref:non-specific serine/threonine protein kinase n=1 Tax=Patella caerulea TaxID=87958 RepID=A0AAN8JZZ8_PATCE